MGKHIKVLALLLLMTVSVMCFPRYASAEEDLYITDWVVDATLLDNGDLRISEDITFEFNDKFNGVYRDIVLDQTSGLSDITVARVNGDKLSDYSLVTKAKKGDKGVFTLEEEKNKVIVKIFTPSKDERKTYRISYLVKNVAVKYKDTGELYYKFLGKGNETSIGRFIVYISLPYKDDSEMIKVYAHGPLNGSIKKIQDDRYQLKVDNVATKTFIEARILFPREFIAGSSNIKNQDRYQEVIDEEATFQAKREQDLQKREDSRKLLNNITLAFSSISVLALAIILYQCRRNINKDFIRVEIRDIPEECTPAVAARVTGIYVNSNMIFATILDLFRKGYVRISGEGESKDILSNENFVIHKTKDADMFLLGHERFFMNWLFDDMGNGQEVSTDDIKYYSKHSSQKYLESQLTWKKKIKAEADKRGYYDHSKKRQGITLIMLSMISMVLGVITAIYTSIYALLSFVIGSVLLPCGISLFFRFSEKGYLQYKRWIGFQKYWKKHYLELEKEDVLDSLDLSLIYALGLNVMKKLKLAYGYEGEYTTNSWLFWYIMFASGNNNSFHDSINNSFVGNAFSSSSDSFSSGGGGGAGGGGAGGF